jgi:hypothetical protein
MVKTLMALACEGEHAASPLSLSEERDPFVIVILLSHHSPVTREPEY